MTAVLSKGLNRLLLNTVTCFPVFTVNVSRPELTLVAGAKGPTVQCEVRSSSSKLEMEFLNDEGNVLPSDKLKFNSEDPDFLSVTREMLVPDSISRFEFA